MGRLKILSIGEDYRNKYFQDPFGNIIIEEKIRGYVTVIPYSQLTPEQIALYKKASSAFKDIEELPVFEEVK